MQIVSKETIDHYEAEIDDLEAQVAELEPMRPMLQLAQMLRDEVITLMGTNGAPEFSPQEVGEMAYKNVLKTYIGEAREKLAAKYAQEYRSELQDRVIKEVEATEGPSILEDVHAKVDSDPELALKLRNLARTEIAARALGIVHTEISAQQEEVVNKEAERQLALDRLDVQFAFDRELDLESAKISEMLEPGDKLVIYRKGDKDKRYPLVLTWTKDANDKEGWTWTETPSDTYQKNSDGYWKSFTPGGGVFVKVGVQDKDLEKATDVIQENTLVMGLPLVIITNKGKNIFPTHGSTDYYGDGKDMRHFIIDSTDFQTKDLVFTEGEYKDAKKKS